MGTSISMGCKSLAAALTITAVCASCNPDSSKSDSLNDLISWDTTSADLFYTPDSALNLPKDSLRRYLDLTIRGVYPVAKNEEDKLLVDSLTREINRHMFDKKFDQYGDFEEAAKSYTQSIKAAYQEDLRAIDSLSSETNRIPHIVWMDISDSLVYNGRGFISLQVENQSYTGGAHGMESSTYLNYDLLNRHPLSTGTLFNNREAQELIALVKEGLVRYFGVSDTSQLENQGIYSADEISVPDNFYLSEDSIHFVYNPYEIAPYVVGSIESSVSFKDLEGTMKKEYRDRLLSIRR